MNEPDTLDRFPAFMAEVRARLEAGREEYGDRSFARPPAELLGELEQEALDLCAWSYILWCRIEAMRKRTEGT